MAKEKMDRPALNLTVEQVKALVSIETNVRKIQALTGNPHWHADRRWQIEHLADEIDTMLEAFVNVLTSPSEG